MKLKWPPPVAYCWYHGREMTKRDIERSACTNPDKQYDKVCKHLMRYGPRERTGGARLTMQELYDQIKQTLEDHGMRLEGSRMCLVQELPDGSTLRFWLDDADRRSQMPPCRKEQTRVT